MDEPVCRNIEKYGIRVASKVVAEIGITSLKTKQVEAITSFVAGQHTFVSLSTEYRIHAVVADSAIIKFLPEI